MPELVWGACACMYMAYVHVLVVCTYVCTSIHACACGNQMLMLSLFCVGSWFFETALSLSMELTIQPHWLANKPRESTYFWLPHVYHAWLSHGCLELKLRCLWSENFTLWTIPQPLALIFSKGNPSKHLQKWYSWKEGSTISGAKCSLFQEVLRQLSSLHVL